MRTSLSLTGPIVYRRAEALDALTGGQRRLADGVVPPEPASAEPSVLNELVDARRRDAQLFGGPLCTAQRLPLPVFTYS